MKRRTIVCLNDGKHFDSIKDASDFYKIHSTKISYCCSKRNKATKLKNGTLITFRYKEEYDNLKTEDIKYLLNRLDIHNYSTRKVVCMTHETVFNSIKEASEYYGIKPLYIGNCCAKRIKYTSDKFGNKTTWKYYNKTQ